MKLRVVAFPLLFLIPACNPEHPREAILLSSSTALFTVSLGGPNPPDQSILMTGENRLLFGQAAWTASSDQPWLTITPTSGTIATGQTVPLTLQVAPNFPPEAWTGPTSTVNAPATGASVHSGMAVWTGDQMLVWNGDPAIGGKYYDPVSNSWSGSITATGAPEKRTYFSAVWTGTEMIVWGGITFWGGAPLNSGGRYNPSTDTWTPMSTAGAPSPRWSHRAVWTGSQMIVWGGDSGGFSFKNTGGVYDPATDTWVRATTVTSAPSARANHAAVWTGTRMLIWGGEDVGKFNTGAFYDPVNDAWTGTTTMTGVPAARSHMDGVWTGGELIIWGGHLSLPGNPINTGVRYNPTTDGWTGATSLVGVPEARSSHAMVWTGSRMIVWGGTSASALLDTGGIYRPPISAPAVRTAVITISVPGGYTPTQQITVTLNVTP